MKMDRDMGLEFSKTMGKIMFRYLREKCRLDDNNFTASEHAVIEKFIDACEKDFDAYEG